MPKIFTTLDKIKPAYDITYKVVLFICKILLIADILITTMSVIGRYVPFIPDPAWSEEVVLTCMSYMAVLSAALAIRRGAHIRMTAFDVYLPKAVVKVLDILADAAVMVLGIGNRRVTADALGPRTAQKILVTMGPQHTLPVKGIRPVAAIAPGVSASTGLTLRQLAGAMVEAVRPAALICVDSLCSAEGARLGRSVQFSDTGLYPAQADHAKHLDAASLGVPVLAAGIPTLMESDEGADLVVTPRALDSVIAHGSALLAGAINRALQPRLSLTQLCWLTG